MGDWLGDTLEAAQHMASLMERARAAPKLVTQELHAYALGMADQTQSLMDHVRTLGQADRLAASALAPRAVERVPEAPPSNTGVNYAKAQKAQKKGKS